MREDYERVLTLLLLSYRCAVSGPSVARRKKTPSPGLMPGRRGFIFCGSYRDRTDDIHGVNVALYQLS